MEQALLVMTNVPDNKVGESIARHVIEQRLAACVNCLPGIKSIYRWQDAVEEAAEITLLIKTIKSSYAQLEAVIKTLHPYQVPEIIAVPIEQGLPVYLDWVINESKNGANANHST